MKRFMKMFIAVMAIMVLTLPTAAFAKNLTVGNEVTTVAASGVAHTVVGTSNYLALRSTPQTTQSNEIGMLHNGDIFYVTGRTGNFAYGYTSYNKYGYVNANYLRQGVSQPQYDGTVCTVSGVNNYLGLRSTPTRNDRDEIGRLYNGDRFVVLRYEGGFAYGHTLSGVYGYVVGGYLR